MQEVLTLKEAADFLRASPNTIYNLIKKHEIPASKIGRQYKFTRLELLSWLAEHSLYHRSYLKEYLEAIFQDAWDEDKAKDEPPWSDEQIVEFVESVRKKKGSRYSLHINSESFYNGNPTSGI
ncbi:MAG: helix-turn-helix domain-containing protein [bacterium]|nr:helix-turn-helix domain-containing protein [bacterium]